MTLNNWVNSGGAMLSNRCVSLCCQEIGCNEEQLREMHIHDIYALAPLGGKVAKREIDRCSISHLTKIVNKRMTNDHQHSANRSNDPIHGSSRRGV